MHVMKLWFLGYMDGHSSYSPWLNHECKIECLQLVVTTCNFKSTNSSIVKLLHTNSPVSDYKIFTQIFRLAIVVDWMQRLCFMTGFVIGTRTPTVAPKGHGKSLNLCIEPCPFEYAKTCSRICIYIYLRSINTLNQMADKKTRSAICTNLDRSRCSSWSVKISGSWLVKPAIEMCWSILILSN